MFLFEREEWRYWMKFSRNVEVRDVGRYAGDGKSYEFYWDDYKAIVWSGHFDGYASVHSKDGEEVFCHNVLEIQIQEVRRQTDL